MVWRCPHGGCRPSEHPYLPPPPLYVREGFGLDGDIREYKGQNNASMAHDLLMHVQAQARMGSYFAVSIDFFISLRESK